MPLDAGCRLGPYEILAPIGAGGMGEVYRARDGRLGRDVAVKVVPPAGQHLQRFEQEARAVAALSHPNVLAIYDVGVDGLPFLVTELLDGATLREHIAAGPLPVQRTIDLALQLVAGLNAAHAQGIVHRDLKPDNIFVTTEGRVKILDFGLARRVRPVADCEPDMTCPQTIPGTVLGTLAYMAPEQLRGFTADQRADIFACGAILFEMLTGRRAFRGETAADTISAVLNDPPSALEFAARVPRALAGIVRRCLSKDPDRRFQSAGELSLAIEAIADVRADSDAPFGEPVRSSIAVLPFADSSGDPETRFFSDGLAEDLVNALIRLPGLRVASRTSSFRFRNRETDVRKIGRDLGVGTILEGSVRRSGARLRVTVQLTDAADGYHLWSERYDREIADAFDVQDEIVHAIVSALAPTLVPDAPVALSRDTRAIDPPEVLPKGRHLWNRPAARPHLRIPAGHGEAAA
jgi:serine/threonine protein kinase